jgi:hypothetical protein
MDWHVSVATWRFGLGQTVRWVEDPQQCRWIAQRRWTEREGLTPIAEYRLRSRPELETAFDWGWRYEVSLEEWGEEG